MTGRSGTGVLPGLNPDLRYTLLVAAPEFETATISDVPYDTLMSVGLRPFATDAGSGAILEGRVLDPHGRSLRGARLTPYGLKLPELRRFGPLDGTSPIAVTDARGRYAFRIGDTVASYYVRIERPGYGPRVAEISTRGPATIRLAPAATVFGKLMFSGAPGAGVRIIAAPQDRRAEVSVGPVEATTDERGNFVLGDMAPETEYFVIATSASVPPDQYVPKSRVRTPAGVVPIEVALISRADGVHLTGRIHFGDSADAARPRWMILGSDSAFDSTPIEIAADGAFRSRMVPNEPFWLALRSNRWVIRSVSESSAVVRQYGVYFPSVPAAKVAIEAALAQAKPNPD